MSAIRCQFPDCAFEANDASEEIAVLMFKSHLYSHQQPVRADRAPTKQKIPPISRPVIKQDVTDEDWATFVAEWGNFRRCTDIPPGCEADQLFQCCEKSLGRLVLRENPAIIAEGVDTLLKAIERMAVIKVATSVRRTNLLGCKQAHGETIREFYANLKASAATCNYTVKCPNACCLQFPAVDYTPSIVKDVLVAGIAESDIRKDVLGWPELDEKSDKDLVAFIEAKELARNAWNSTPITGAAGLSNYRKDSQGTTDQSLKAKLSLKGKCSVCSKTISLYALYTGSGRLNKQPYKMCKKCYKECKDNDGQSKQDSSSVSSNSRPSESDMVATFIGSIEADSSATAIDFSAGTTVAHDRDVTCPEVRVNSDVIKCEPEFSHDSLLVDDLQIDEYTHISSVNTVSQMPFGEKKSIELDHHIFTQEGWQRATTFSHPTLRLRVTTKLEDYAKFSIEQPRISPKYVNVVVDSGAQSCLWSRSDFLASGFSIGDLIPVRHAMKAANAAPISIDGAILLRLSGRSKQDALIEAAVMTYVSPDAKSFFLSREAMVQLGIISQDFPQLGSTASQLSHSECDNVEGGDMSSGESSFESSPRADCGCLKREPPPSKPESLPYPAVAGNAEAMKCWLLDTYASSTFNKCPHQPLPVMEGPPLQIHIDKNAQPIALKKPVPVALHWKDQVEQDLLRDVSLGVLERVPHGEPTTWCFKMLVTRKEDGGPRRIIDLSPLNKYCEREVHTSKSPFTLARSVPEGSIKTAFDAWNGYHAVLIREEDRKYFTFSTTLGLMRCKRAPQGSCASGDGYNRRFEDITSHIARMERCVDDSLLHDTDTETHWWRVIEFIELCGKAGVVLNPEKLQFSQLTVDFAGFRITENTVEPLPKYVDAIKNFPVPESITDMRSWFGLVNQVSHYAQLREDMEPFRRFLSPKVKFEWNEDLSQAFQRSKQRIVEAIKEGVQIFDIKRRTCLRTDWSKKGIGFFLAQQHCGCEIGSYGCCPDGWRITLAGSRFLSPTETNYAPIEGEALAVAWSLEQTKYFTMGCDNLLVIVDHKPLTKIFGDRRLDEIENPRLLRLKRRTRR